MYIWVCMSVCVLYMLLKCKVAFKWQSTEGCLKNLLSIPLSWVSEFRDSPP